MDVLDSPLLQARCTTGAMPYEPRHNQLRLKIAFLTTKSFCPIRGSIARIVVIPLLLDVKRSKRVAGEGESGVSVPIVIVVSLMDIDSSS